jgi:hypothetical protein
MCTRPPRACGASTVAGATVARATPAAASAAMFYGIPTLLLLAASGCAQPKPVPPPAKPPKVVVAAPAPVRPICRIETAFGVDKPPRDRNYPAQNWFVLMLHAYRSTGEIARPLNDCSETPVKVDDDGCRSDPQVVLTPTALTTKDLVVTSLGEARRLVWVITERLSDGQAQGPVAIAEIEPRGIAVRALGVLRTYSDNVTLRLEQFGGATVLVADGQRCEEHESPETCERAIRVVPLVGNRFVSKPLVDALGNCMGSSLLLVRSKGRAGKTTHAKYELETSVTFGANAILIREHLGLSRGPGVRNTKDPSASESFVTTLQLERQVVLRNGRLVTDGPSLLTRWLAQQEPGNVGEPTWTRGQERAR